MSQMRPHSHHFEHILEKTGWGLYYKFLIGYAGANLFANGWTFLCVLIGTSLSACETQLAETDIVFIYVSFVLGTTFGGFLICCLSDNLGKKVTITKTQILLFIGCFISAFSYNKYTLAFAAVILGSGLQANSIMIKIYIAEILPMNKRGLYTVLPDLFWSLGFIIPAVFLYFFDSNQENIQNYQFLVKKLPFWRIIFAIGGGLFLTLGCISALLETGPRFLLLKKRNISAWLLLKQLYAINKSKYSETFELHSQELVNIINDYGITINPEPVGLFEQCFVLIKQTKRIIGLLLSRKFLKIIAMVSVMKIFLSGIITSIFFLTQIINDNERIYGKNLTSLSIVYPSNCTATIDDLQYNVFLLLFLNVFIGQLITIIAIERIGRKILICLIVCGLTCIILEFSKNFSLTSVVSSIYLIGYTSVESTLCVIIVESFPTAVRGTAMGLTHFYASIISCFVYIFLNVKKEVFLGVIALGMIGGSIVSFSIPEMKKRPMVE